MEDKEKKELKEKIETMTGEEYYKKHIEIYGVSFRGFVELMNYRIAMEQDDNKIFNADIPILKKLYKVFIYFMDCLEEINQQIDIHIRNLISREYPTKAVFFEEVIDFFNHHVPQETIEKYERYSLYSYRIMISDIKSEMVNYLTFYYPRECANRRCLFEYLFSSVMFYLKYGDELEK